LLARIPSTDTSCKRAYEGLPPSQTVLKLAYVDVRLVNEYTPGAHMLIVVREKRRPVFQEKKGRLVLILYHVGDCMCDHCAYENQSKRKRGQEHEISAFRLSLKSGPVQLPAHRGPRVAPPQTRATHVFGSNTNSAPNRGCQFETHRYIHQEPNLLVSTSTPY